MSESVENNIADIHTAYRLILQSRLNEAKNKGDSIAEKAAQDALDKDDADISDAAKAASSSSTNSQTESTATSNVQISLNDLVTKLQTGNNPNQTQQVTLVNVQQTVETAASLTYYDLEKIDGLVVKSQNLAETDRYAFEFMNGSTLKVTDKWNNRSTTIWGDPHIDVSDVEGENNGDFKDLTKSDQYTTFMLKDGTRLTITAQDSSIIEKVDIFKDQQHLSGIGGASTSWNDQSGLFAKSVKNDAYSASSAVPVGDVVYAGGDGNDWYDAAGNLVWGKTTGPAVNSRPSSYLEFQYSQKVTQSVSVVQVNQQA